MVSFRLWFCIIILLVCSVSVNALSDGLVAFWEFEESGGTRADSHGSFDLADFNSVGSSLGVVGNAASYLDSNGERLWNSNIGFGSGDASFAVWARLDSSDSGNYRVIASQGGNSDFTILKHAFGDWRFKILDSAGNQIDYIDSSFSPGSDGAWYFLVFTFDSSSNTVRIYINGELSLEDTTSLTSGSLKDSGGLMFGVREDGFYYLSGGTDQAGVWHRVLSESEISCLYNNGNGRSYAGLSSCDGGGSPGFASPISGFSVSDSGSGVFDVGVDDTLVYRVGYFRVDGGAWNSFSLGGSRIGNWVFGVGNANLDLSSFAGSGVDVVVYSCSYSSGWDCRGNWQLRSVQVSVSGPSVSGYSGLRSTSGSSGQTVSISDPVIGGIFAWQSSDPYGNGDDGGIVIAASGGGYWVRQWSYGPGNPIELDWFELSNGDSVTQLFRDIASAMSPEFYVRMPSSDMTLLLSFTDFSSLGISRVRILENPLAETVIQHDPSDPNKGELLYFRNMNDVVLGTDVKKASRDDYHLTFKGKFAFDDHAIGLDSTSMIKFSQNSGCNCEIYIRVNTLDPWGNGVRHMGGRGNTDTLYFSGVHDNSAFTVHDGSADTVVVEDAYISDPYGVQTGWTGLSDGSADCTESDGDPAMWHKGRGTIGFFGTINRVLGSVEMQYGGSNAGIMFPNDIGTSSDPFTITFKDPMYTRSGVKIKLNQMHCPLEHSLKFDGTGVDEPGHRFVELVEGPHDFGNGMNMAVFLEANAYDDVSGDGLGVITSYIDFTLSGLSEKINGRSTGSYVDNGLYGIVYQGYSRNSVASTDGVMITDRGIVRDGIFHDVVVRDNANGEGGGNLIENVGISGSVEVYSSMPNTVLRDVDFTGSPREVMTIGSDSDVTSNNLCAPSGSTITGSGSLVLNGVTRSLPYTFDGTECLGVQSYDDLRSKSGSSGDTVELQGSDIGGTFAWQSSDPYGNGDDGGIVISANGGGYWVRQWSYGSNNPIELDWFELSDGDDITSLWNQLSSDFSPNFYVKMPSMKMELWLGTWDASDYNINRLRILENPSAHVTLRQRDSSEPWISFGTMDDLVIGTDVKKASRDDYLLTFRGRATPTSYADLSYNTAMIKWCPGYQDHRNIDVYLRFNTRDSYAVGFTKCGLGKVDTVYMSGRHVNSNVAFGEFGMSYPAQGLLVFENLYVSDPYGAGYGWKGDPSGSTVKGAWSKWRGLRISGQDKAVGEVTLQYGWAGFRSFFSDRWGDSGSPFKVNIKDMGFLGPESGFPGVKLQAHSGVLNNALKWDGQKYFNTAYMSDDPDDSSHMRYFHIEEDNQWGSHSDILTVFVESNVCDDNACGADFEGLKMSYFDVTLTNFQEGWGGTAAGGVGHPYDRIHHWTFRGDGVNPASVPGSQSITHAADYLTFRDGQFHDIFYRRPSNLGDPGVTSDGNVGTNLVITGSIRVDNDIASVDLSDITWSGSAREILTVGSNSFVTADNLCAPSGSTITGSGSLVLNGVSKSLPYTFDGSECLN